jgi:hypothetical protein
LLLLPLPPLVDDDDDDDVVVCMMGLLDFHAFSNSFGMGFVYGAFRRFRRLFRRE